MGQFWSFSHHPPVLVLVAAEFAWKNHPFIQQLYAHLGEYRKGVGIIVKKEECKTELKSAQIWTMYSRVFMTELMEFGCVKDELDQLEAQRKKMQEFRPFPHNVYTAFLSQFPTSCYGDRDFDTAANTGHYETAVFVTSGALIGDHPFSPTEDSVAAKDREHCRQALAQLEKEIENGQICLSKMTPESFIHFLKTLHASLFSGTSKDGLVMPGQWRRCAVNIRGASWCPPQHDEVPALMERYAHWATTAHKELPAPIYALELHLHLAFIHPFADGNGRIARAVLNLALFGQGYPPLVIPTDRKRDFIDTMDAAFGTTRDVYYQMGLSFLEKSCTKLLDCLKTPRGGVSAGGEGQEGKAEPPTPGSVLGGMLDHSDSEEDEKVSEKKGLRIDSVGGSHLEIKRTLPGYREEEPVEGGGGQTVGEEVRDR